MSWAELLMVEKDRSPSVPHRTLGNPSRHHRKSQGPGLCPCRSQITGQAAASDRS